MSKYEEDKIKAALDEVRRLNLKKASLESENKKLESEIEKNKSSLKFFQSEVQKASEDCKRIGKEAASLKADLAKQKADVDSDIAELRRINREISQNNLDLEKKIAEDLEILTRINGAKANQKEAAAKAASDVAKASEILEKAKSDTEAFNADKARLAILTAEINAQKDKALSEYETKKKEADDLKCRLLTEIANAEARKKAFEKASDEIRVSRKMAEDLIEQNRQKSVVLQVRKDELDALILSAKKEQEAIGVSKMQVEIDRLRLDKLAKEKQLSQELAELRKK